MALAEPRPPSRPSGRRLPRALAVAAALAVLVGGSAAAVTISVRHPLRLPTDSASRPRALPAVGPSTLPAAGTSTLLPAAGVLFGAWVQPVNGFTDAGQESSITAFERLTGRKLAIDSLYTQWSEPMPLTLASWDLDGGRVPMISWGPVNSAQVAAGAFDQQIRWQAAQLKSLHGPVLLRYFPEMNNSFVATNAGSPDQFIAAWRHVFKIFKTVGATNVQWVWCPTSIGFATGAAERFYPGEAYVNWIGADGYNWAPGLPSARWRSFAAIFSAFYRWADRQGRPLLVAEFGTDEGTPGAKATWFRLAGQQLQTLFPRIRAVVYFNSAHQNFGVIFNWMVDSSPSALAAFRAVVRNAYFSARPTI